MAAAVLADRCVALLSPEGELAVARAAERGRVLRLSVAQLTASKPSRCEQRSEDVPAAAFKNRELTQELIERCKRAGYSALCLTVDAAVRGKRERELRAGMGVLPRLTFSSMGSFALRPRWFLSQLPRGSLSMPISRARAGHGAGREWKVLNEQLDCTMSWNEVRAMIELWDGPFAIKRRDARR